MGKAHKPHRIGLLYKLHQQGLLNDSKCIWSCLKLDIDSIKEFLPDDVNNTEFDEFLSLYHRTADRLEIVIKPDGSPGYKGGFPFDETLYSKTNISLVSETRLFGTPFITEKTYRTIINHHPFVVAGPPEQNKELEAQGFLTFDKFMKFPLYNRAPGSLNQLDELVENLKNFNPSADEIDAINQVVVHNANRLQELVKEESDKITEMLVSYRVADDWTSVMSWEDSNHFFLNWQFYYQKIKGPTWPHCDSVKDCNQLPEHIQQELRTVFKLTF